MACQCRAIIIVYSMKITLPTRLRRYGWVVGLVAVVALGYYYFAGTKESATVTSAMVVETVAQGTVTTGIQTTGTIEAAEVLDLNVYKTAQRIDALSVENGMHVEEGALLFAFDDSDVAVDINASALSIREAELQLGRERAGVADPNTTITTLKNDITELERDIALYEAAVADAHRNFLNTDLEAVPTSARYDEQVNRTAPTIGGLYDASQNGEYRLRVYASGGRSGLSYTLSGLEGGTHEVVLGAETPLGTRGLTITFQNDTVNRDEWVIAVPNTYAPEYAVRRTDHEEALADLDEAHESDLVALENKRTQLLQALREDTLEDRTLEIEAAELAIERAQVGLEQGRDTRSERRIVAPFAGTVEGMENVVVGATPKNDNSDSVDFGVLISDDFLVNFSLGASDVDTVSLGQKVIVSLTSVPDSTPLTAEITEISSLPESTGVAQYKVKARLAISGEGVRLRDGMLADIEIVREEKQDVVRVPVATLHYSAGKAYVTMVEDLTKEQEQQLDRLGIVRTDLSVPTTYEREVTVGLRGSYFAEIIDGLAVGERIKVSENAPATTENAPVVRTGFGAGGGRPPDGRDE